MSTTVGEMSTTVGGNVRNSGGKFRNSGGKCLQQWGDVRNSGEIEYGLGNLRVEIIVHNFDGLPFRVHGIKCTKFIRI